MTDLEKLQREVKETKIGLYLALTLVDDYFRLHFWKERCNFNTLDIGKYKAYVGDFSREDVESLISAEKFLKEDWKKAVMWYQDNHRWFLTIANEMKDWEPIDENWDSEPELEKEIVMSEEEYNKFTEVMNEIDPAYKEMYEEFERLMSEKQ